VSGFTINLAAGTYVFVVTGFWNYSVGNYAVTVAGPGHVGLPFTDAPIVAGSTVIRGVHITELRVRIDGIRSRFSLAPYAWTDPAIVRGVTLVKAQHILDLRAALADVYMAAGRTPPVYTGQTPALGVTITATQINETRAAAFAIE
jgi:hypothetical protein